MGSAEELEALQRLGQQPAPEATCQPSAPGCQHRAHCGAGETAMRNCCVNERGVPDSQESGAGAGSPSPAGKALAPDSSSPAGKAPEPSAGGVAASTAAALPGAGTRPLEKSGESAPVPGNCSGQDGEAAPVGAASGLAGTCTPPGSAGPKEPADGPSARPALEPCLKAPGKDSGGAPAPLKHVAFLEPATRDALAGGTGADEPCPTPSAPGPPHAPPSTDAASPPDGAGLQGASQGSAHEKAPASPARPAAQLGPPADAAAGSPGDPAPRAPAPLAKEPAPGGPGEAPGRADAALPEHAGPTRRPSPPSPAGSPGAALGASSAAAPKTDGAGERGESQGAAAGEPRRGEDAGALRPALSKGCSFEVTPPPQDAGTQDTATQVDSRASLVSVAVSPINPPGSASAFPFQTQGQLVSVAVSPINPLDGASAFPFQSQGPGSAAAPSSPVPAKKDAEMQVSMSVETRSVATGPMTPVSKSPQASYPEVRVKGAAEEAPEPIREVSWDEKGMTWEVYGAAMEVEVLGMAIQKHLEKQIEEHGRQMVLTPQSTRASSIKGAPRGKAKAKRPPGVFRALLQSVRRPRCCSRAGPAAE